MISQPHRLLRAGLVKPLNFNAVVTLAAALLTSILLNGTNPIHATAPAA